MDILNISACSLGEKIAGRELSAVEATQLALNQINKDRKYNAYILVDEEKALNQAKKTQMLLDRGDATSPLAGVPMAVKDNISTAGLATTCASNMLKNYVPPFSATAVERLQAGGAVILGKTNMDEFAMGSTNETSALGAVCNPWAGKRSPGGSSGGSAAAVAARQAWYALGSDTGGSIRQPCSYCNLTGIKPTYGTVSRYGLIAYASSLDQIGPMARCAADCALALSLIAGHDDKDSTSLPVKTNLNPADLVQAARSPKDLKDQIVGLPENWLQGEINPEISKAIYRAADQLRSLGARIKPVSISFTAEAVPAYYLVASAEASGNLARYDGIQYGLHLEAGTDESLAEYYSRTRSAGFGREVQRRILLGTFALSAGYYESWYLKALQVRRLIIESYRQVFAECTCLLTPVTMDIAPCLGESLADPLRLYLEDVFTVAANLAGLPALALPCGLDNKGLPIGMQLLGPPLSDARLLAIGNAYQQITDYHLAVPEEVES